MKKHSSLSFRQLCFCIGALLAFSCLTLFLFTFRRDEKRFASITASLFTEEMKANTLSMHYTIANPEDFGICGYRPTLACYAPGNAEKSRAALENTLAALGSVRTEKLTEPDSYLWKLLTRSLENSLELGNYPYFDSPLSPISGMQSQLPILLAEYTFRSKRDVEDYLSLLEQTDGYLSSLLLYEQEKAAAGLPACASSLQSVRKQCDTIVTSEALEAGTHFLQTTFQERLETLLAEQKLSPEEAAQYTARNNRLLKTVLLPAYQALGDGLLLLEDSSVLLQGLAATEGGRSYYEKLLISETGSYRPVPEIQELLAEAFSREYESVRSLIISHPDLLQEDGTESSSFPYKNSSQILLDLQQRMSGSFPSIPGGSVTASVKPVSPSLEDYCAPAFYLTAPLDDTDVNSIYINRSKTPEGLDLYTTLAHEGYPGHLYQTVYYNRSACLRGERPARELLWYGGYQEGWALYVEFMSYDYASALLREYSQEKAALTAQLEKHNRSLQLCLYSMLDIMIHYENASYSTVAKTLEGFGITDSASARAIYAYIVQEPCNYLKYYLGYLEILSLREQARELWQAEYSDLRFHTFFLDCGPSDFTSLRERLEE